MPHQQGGLHMTIMELGALGEFVASLGVIGSLIFVGIQLRHNTATLNTSVTTLWTDKYQQFQEPIAASVEVARVFRIGLYEPDSLDEDESVQFEYLVAKFAMVADAMLVLHRQGALSDDRYEAVKGDIRSLLGSPGGYRFFDSLLRVGMPSLFVNEVDSILQAGGETFRHAERDVRDA